MGRTTVCLEPRKALSLRAVGELMDKQVGAQLAIFIHSLKCKLLIQSLICLACMDGRGLVCFQLCADVLSTLM